MLSWFYVFMALSLDVAGTVTLKLSSTARQSSLLTGAAYLLFILSVMCFGFAMKKLEVGFISAVWAGGGLAILALIGMLYFNEAVTAPKLFCLALVIVGIIGLSLQQTQTSL